MYSKIHNAAVGTAVFTWVVTHTILNSVIVFEKIGQITHIFSIMASFLSLHLLIKHNAELNILWMSTTSNVCDNLVSPNFL